MKTIKVKIEKQFGPYTPGDVATFPEERANAMVEAGVATKCEDKKCQSSPQAKTS